MSCGDVATASLIRSTATSHPPRAGSWRCEIQHTGLGELPHPPLIHLAQRREPLTVLDARVAERKGRAMTTIDDILESFEFLDSWEERYRFIIDLGKQLPPMDDAFKTPATKVEGCMSQVWMVGRVTGAPPVVDLVADSDAIVVRGLIAVLMILYSGKAAAEILATDIEDLFERLGFASHISVNRRNGFFAMVERIKSIARQAA